ncbi:MAG: hypothetical protein IKI75_04620 [Lachnospiraceae bacterium]|nr:hypothetical protein [Lachnospiraceae bacterium]
METFLLVLKISGLVLLGILAFLLLMLLLIVFVPYRYRLSASKKDGFGAEAKVSWLLHMVTVRLIYDAGVNLRVKFLCFCIYDKKKKKEKAEKKAAREAAKAEKAAAKKKKKPAGEELKEAENEELFEENEIKNGHIFENKKEEPGKDTAEKEPEEKEKDTGSGRDKESRKKAGKIPAGKRLEGALDAVLELPGKIEEKLEEGVEGLFDKIDEVIDLIDYYERLLSSQGTEKLLETVKKHVIKILKAMKPTRFDGELELSDDDPGTVAKVYEYYALALPFISKIKGRVRVNAQQGDKSFVFRAVIKGRLLLFPVAVHGAALFFNKKLKLFIKKLKREE